MDAPALAGPEHDLVQPEARDAELGAQADKTPVGLVLQARGRGAVLHGGGSYAVRQAASSGASRSIASSASASPMISGGSRRIVCGPVALHSRRCSRTARRTMPGAS